MFRILDRYVIRNFLAPFVYCMLTFIILFIIGDLFEHLDKFLKIPNWPSVVLKYYILFIPSTFVFITAAAILLALLYSLGKMQRNNEISAMRTAGISIYRITFPLLLASLFISLGVLYINETVVPHTLKQSALLKQEKAANGIKFEELLRDITIYNPLSDRSYYFESFNTGNNTGTGVTIYELKDGKPFKRISAREAAWLDGRWWLFKGFIYNFPEGEKPVKKVLTKESFDFEVRPEDLRESKKEFSNLSWKELRQSIKRKEGFPLSTLRPALVELHQKIALPLAGLIMGLIGISFGMRIGRGGMLAGAGICLILGFLYYSLFSFAGALGKQAFLPPWLAAWAGNIVFGIGGLITLSRLN